MPIKKSELYTSLWKSCDELCGGMDASQYKDYVLILLFVKYISDKYAGQPDALIEVPAGGGFADMAALKGDKEIGDKINKIIARLAEANDLKGVIDVADFNDADKLGRGKEMVDRLSNLVAIFENPGLDFSRNRAEGDDLLGDAYEYLMRHFATESGKSKGQFYTPAEVSRVMAQVIGIRHAKSQAQTLHDPTCGSGALLIKAADGSPHGVTIYGQEMDNATAALARMNMILHGHPTAEIWRDNTLSSKAWSNGFNPYEDLYGRFEDGIPPQKNGDYAFLLHLLRSLKSTGKGAIILPHGVLFRGNVEGDIRRNLVRRGVIKGIIGLPANLFYGTGIPACILVLDKENAAEEDVQDIAAHLRGGVPNRDVDALARYWDVFPGLKATLFAPGKDGRITVETQNLASLPDAKSCVSTVSHRISTMEKYKGKYRIPSARWAAWDYGSNAAYFVTICINDRSHGFGEGVNAEMVLTPLGQAAVDCWDEIPTHFPFVVLGGFVVMPNHIHGIIIIDKPDDGDDAVQTQDIAPVQTQDIASLPRNKFGPQSQNLASIVRGYKIGVTKYAREHNLPFRWQERYHDHVIRNEGEYERIRKYIEKNPQKWADDTFYAP